MSLLQRLLLLPLLSPLLAVLLLGAVNPRPWVALRLLTWISPALPLGAWISAAAATGAALSAAGTTLALRQGELGPRERRQVRWQGERDTPRRDDPPPGRDVDHEPATSAWAGPSRSASDPPPTVSVPFRVVRKGRPTKAAATASAAGSGTARATATGSGAAGDADDWDRDSSDAW